MERASSDFWPLLIIFPRHLEQFICIRINRCTFTSPLTVVNSKKTAWDRIHLRLESNFLLPNLQIIYLLHLDLL
jgi:hypothetical protein